MKSCIMTACIGLSMLAPYAAAQGVTVFHDVSYFSPGGESSTLDVYLPPLGPQRGTPTVLFVHGGGWSDGDKAAPAVFCEELAAEGYPVVSANYTLADAGSPSFPQCVFDLKAVVRWIRTTGQSPQFGLHRDICAAGSSAGGHLALMVATTAGQGEFEPLPPPAGGYRIQAAVSLWGLTDAVWDVQNGGQDAALTNLLGAPLTSATRPLYKSASPINHVSACDPATAFYHGTADDVVPYQHSLRMAAAYQPWGIYSQIELAPGGGHGFDAFGGQVPVARSVAAVIPVLMRSLTTADYDNSGFVDTDDFTTFVLDYQAGERDADFDHSGYVDTDDFDAFVRTFEAGC